MNLVCPNCKHPAYLGAIFCEECGTRLPSASPSSGSTQSLRFGTDSMANAPADAPVVREVHPQEDGGGRSVIVLQLLDGDQVLYLRDKTEFTLGRGGEDQKILPDVDFSPFMGFERGVSRLHAAVRVSGKTATLTDLGSSNGTRLNGERLTPHISRTLQSGDILALGKLKLRVIVRL